MIAFFASMAWAGGIWHPNDVAAQSKRFAAASEKLLGPADRLQAEDEQAAAALRAYRVAVDLLGERAPAQDRERLAALEADWFAQHNRAQAFLDTLVLGFDDAFSASVQSAVAAAGAGEPCEREIPVGPQLPGLRPRTQPNPACQGEDLNPKIAAAVDADPALAAALDKLLAAPFPSVALEKKAMAPIGAGDRWIAVSAFFDAGARDRLAAIDQADDDARVEIDAAVEAGDEAAVLAMKDRASQIADATAKSRAELAAPVLAAADKAAAKDGGVAWCANPVALGGCTGTDATADLGASLRENAKVAKALTR